ncbi:uncharacterized protein [Magallana gigas]|uniref:uncharacterized protein isoform X1 n=1 Tax=Magallana gigas TaxID=29159 RepID=UPI0033403057
MLSSAILALLVAFGPFVIGYPGEYRGIGGFSGIRSNTQCNNHKIVTSGYPRIRGPRTLDDRIVIVGAGIGGVHMASLLKDRGYRNVVILEQRPEIGGKAYSQFYRGVWNEFGTVFFSDIYDQTANLIKQYTPSFRIKSKADSSVRLNDNEETTWQRILLQNTRETNPQEGLRRIVAQLDRYERIHRCLFGNYSSELMPRPTPDVMYEIRGTVLEFLQRNDLLLLAPYFRVYLTTNGYGYTNETAAIYGLMWVPPPVIRGTLTPENGFWLLEGGFQVIVKEIAKQRNLDIRLGVDVVQIQRKNGPSGVYVTYKPKGSPAVLTDRFDFLILSPAMNSLFDIVDFHPKELNIFNYLVNANYVTSLVESDIGRRTRDPQVYFNQEIDQLSYSMYASISFYHAKNNITGDDYRLGIRENGPDGRSKETAMYYQYGLENPWAKDIDSMIQSKLFTILKRFDKTNPRVLEQIKWGYYFPRFPPPAADRGYLWDILDMQGQFNTWYIGSSVCFESFESVVEYNNLLMKLKH